MSVQFHAQYAILITAILAFHGYLGKSLSGSGTLAAIFLGLVIFTHPSFFWTAILFSFYLVSSRLTKFKAKIKATLEEDYKVGGSRTAIQVFSNGFTGAFICQLHRLTVANLVHPSTCLDLNDPVNRYHRILVFAYLGHFACCNGDTWASELGILSSGNPIHVLWWKSVPRGTNGGVSPLGLIASLAGGAFLGLITILSISVSGIHECELDSKLATFILFVSSAAGLFGSLLDSVLGATLQGTYYNRRTKQIVSEHREISKKESKDIQHVSGYSILDNHQVNFVSSLVISIATGCFADWYFSR